MPSVGLDLCSFLYYKCFPGGQHPDHAALLSLVPIYIVTHASQLPKDFLVPSPVRQLVIGFDCEGVDLCRHGSLCIMQLAFPDAIYLVDAIQGGEKLMKACKPALESSYITKVIHDCKRDSEALYFQFGIKLHNVVDSQVSLINITTLFLDKFAAMGAGEWVDIIWHRFGMLVAQSQPDHVAWSWQRQFLPDISTCMSKQIAYSLIEEQQGRRRSPDDYISFVGLLADPRYCGTKLRLFHFHHQFLVIYICTWFSLTLFGLESVSPTLREGSPCPSETGSKFWTYRPLSELMVRAAADDFVGRCIVDVFCVNDNEYADWPSLPNMPENLMVDGKAPEEEILSVLEIPQGKMGCVIGRKGASILSIKQCCK
ncbi:piRNA biogenesis protein EXD1 [Vitis vinifera]|uniref:PiRNA biogenesis protein EXD1 n=1 Tax=Vitis vinifera TaxID=29760 RepID=A0A438EW71_VITVI|nr:piRNA biogenesis protein EXD1 [Vitis vinifera]